MASSSTPSTAPYGSLMAATLAYIDANKAMKEAGTKMFEKPDNEALIAAFIAAASVQKEKRALLEEECDRTKEAKAKAKAEAEGNEAKAKFVDKARQLTPMEELHFIDDVAYGTRLDRLRQVMPLPPWYPRAVQSDCQPVVISEAAYQLLRQQLNDHMVSDPDNWLLRLHDMTLKQGIFHRVEEKNWFFFNPMSWQNEKGFFGNEQIDARHVRKSWKGLCRSLPPHNYVVRWKTVDGVAVPYCGKRPKVT